MDQNGTFKKKFSDRTTMNSSRSMEQDDTSKKEFIPLSENRAHALRQLYISETRSGMNETPFFLLYLNYAVNCIVEIAGLDAGFNDPFKLADAIKKNNKVDELANFFWFFNIDDPKKSFPDYEKITIKLAEKVFELRNFFTHTNENGNRPLLVDRDLYVFLQGQLLPIAIDDAMRPGLRTDKLFKLKLFNLHDKALGYYEFTRKGLIFLICMALYRDDAYEFCNLFEDMKLPVTTKCPAGKLMEELCDKDCDNGPKCNIAKAKAHIAMFTAFSVRKGRDISVLADDYNYLCFADIMGYLNKVPSIAHDYLSLDNENAKLQVLADASTEVDENKEFKYKLHRRFRDRFLSFAAAYIEDFDIIPCIHFKRMDISTDPGRKRYTFGKETDNRVRMNRHFAIEKNAIRFSWTPEQHYGEIHIDSLRSAISASEIKRLLFLASRNLADKVNASINKYFTAYHRILEEMLNAPDCEQIYLSDGHFLQDFSTITGATTQQLDSEDFLTYAAPFFPANLTRYFTGDDNCMSVEKMRKAIRDRLRIMQNHAADFITRLDKLDKWKKAKHDPEHKTPPPVCGKDEVANPPRSCEMSDANLITWFFRYINLFLENDRKLRQIPLGEQHKGEKDYEYQFIHSLVGKFNLNPKDLWKTLKKRRPELDTYLNILDKNVKRQINNESEELHRNPRFDKNGRPVNPRESLFMLARASADEYSNFCIDEFEKYADRSYHVDPASLQKECRRFGIRPGMPFDRDSLIKTILRIDPESWTHAYDYAAKKPYSNRSLAQSGHIVSQIPFPNDFSSRVDKKYQDFNAELRTMKLQVSLRDFYDVSPLLAYAGTHNKKESQVDPGAAGVRKDSFAADFSGTGISKAVNAIKDVRNQDKILCHIALAYWQEFKNNGTFFVEKDKLKFTESTSIYECFKTPIRIAGTGGRSIVLTINDANRPILSLIRKEFPAIAAYMDPEGKQKDFEFYRMVEALREIRSADRVIRLAMIPLIEKFASFVNLTPAAYSGKSSAEIRNMEFNAYHAVFPKLTKEEYDSIVEIRNKIYHRGIALKADKEKILLENLLKKRF